MGEGLEIHEGIGEGIDRWSEENKEGGKEFHMLRRGFLWCRD